MSYFINMRVMILLSCWSGPVFTCCLFPRSSLRSIIAWNDICVKPNWTADSCWHPNIPLDFIVWARISNIHKNDWVCIDARLLVLYSCLLCCRFTIDTQWWEIDVTLVTRHRPNEYSDLSNEYVQLFICDELMTSQTIE